MQVIELDLHGSDEANDKIVKSLMYYSWDYYIHNIDSLNPENSKAIQIGWTPGKGVGDAKFRIFYVLSSSSLSTATVEKLKSEFSDFIPKLAQEHSDRLSFYASESPKMKKWIESLQERTATDIYNDFLPESRKVFEPEQLEQVLGAMREEHGTIAKLEFQAGQYYKPYSEYDEHVILYYLATFEDGVRSQVKLTYTDLEQAQRRAIMGIHFSNPT
ncbi:hypothetical protein EYS14_22950 [Alteromonadaceae bacterium M269]|nr:hypothetical protein EYS14_22950 [Alteromonadaceae bacterium M269]